MGYFRVMIEMALEETTEIEAEHGTETANGYYQIFGVTASSYSEAVAFVETALVDRVTDQPETAGWLVQMEIDTWSEPADIEGEEFLQDPSQPGVHLVSPPAFFLAADSETEA